VSCKCASSIGSSIVLFWPCESRPASSITFFPAATSPIVPQPVLTCNAKCSETEARALFYSGYPRCKSLAPPLRHICENLCQRLWLPAAMACVSLRLYYLPADAISTSCLNNYSRSQVELRPLGLKARMPQWP